MYMYHLSLSFLLSDAVSANDISRIAKNMYDKSPPAVAFLGKPDTPHHMTWRSRDPLSGDLSNVPKLREVESGLRNKGRTQKTGLFSFR